REAALTGVAITTAAITTTNSARHGTAWPALPAAHPARPSASYWEELSQSHCAGAYTAAVGLAAQLRGAARIRTGPIIAKVLLSLGSGYPHAASASSKALASFRSRVSNPSVNHP